PPHPVALPRGLLHHAHGALVVRQAHDALSGQRHDFLLHALPLLVAHGLLAPTLGLMGCRAHAALRRSTDRALVNWYSYPRPRQALIASSSSRSVRMNAWNAARASRPSCCASARMRARSRRMPGLLALSCSSPMVRTSWYRQVSCRRALGAQQLTAACQYSWPVAATLRALAPQNLQPRT